MPRKGPHRIRLESYVLNSDHTPIHDLSAGLDEYRNSLRNAALILGSAVSMIQENMGGDAAEEAVPHFTRSSDFMTDHAGTFGPASTALTASAKTFKSAKKIAEGMTDVPDDPPPADQSTDEGIKQQAANQTQINQNQAAYEAQEQQAAALTAQLDADNQAAVEELKKIHGIPDPPPAASGGGSPQGPAGGGNPYSGPRGGGSNPTSSTNGTFISGTTGGGNGGEYPILVQTNVEVRPPRPGWIDPPNGGPDPANPFPGTDDGTGDDGGDDGIDEYDASFEGVTADGSGTSGHGILGGGHSGAATAGIIGGAGVGIGAMGLAGRAIAGRGIPGLSGGGRIGATARTGGSAVTGRGAAAGAGSRSARAATRAGAGAGAAGSKGAKGGAGGRGGAGAGAGGRGQGKKKRDKGTVWDGVEDGDQWLEDDTASGSVLD